MLRGAGAHKEGELCVQAIFLLLDVLAKWMEDSKGSAAWAGSGWTTSRLKLPVYLPVFCLFAKQQRMHPPFTGAPLEALRCRIV